MKRIIFLLTLLLAFTAIQAQVSLPKGIIVGTGAEKATLSADELKSLDGVTSNIQTQMNSKAAASGVYTKSESDALLAPKANASAVYTKTETDALLTPKANTATTYTKTEVNNLVTPKANSADVYTKTQADAITTLKANTADVYPKTQTYTQTEVNNLVTPKANASAVYTKTETDALLAPKAVAANVYTKTETNNLVTPKANSADVYTKVQTDAFLGAKIDTTDAVSLTSYVYTKTQVDSIKNTLQSGSARIWPADGVSSGLPKTHTGTTSVTTILTFTIPANSIGTNGSFLFKGLATTDNADATVKKLYFKMNGTIFGYIDFGQWQKAASFAFEVYNVNSLSSQVVLSTGGTNAAYGIYGSESQALSINTAATITVTVDAQNGSAGYTTILHALQVFGN